MRDFSSETLIANERIKAISGTFFNLAAGLVAATAARVYVKEGFDLVAAIWCLGCATLIWLAWKTLALLESEG